MEIKPPHIQITTPNTANVKPATSQWRTGQVFDATLVARPKSDSFTLKVGPDTLQATGKPPAQPNQPLEPGTKLKLEVLATSPQLTLKVLPPPTPAPATTEALKQHLPKQTSLTPLLANLSALVKPSTNTQLPPALVKSIEHLLKSLPTAHQISKNDAEATKRIMKESGIFLEQHLLKSKSLESRAQTLNSDFKANVLKVLQQLQHYQKSDKPTSQTNSDTQKNTLQLKPPLPPLPSLTTPNKSGEVKAPLLNNLPQQLTSTPTLKNAPIQAQARSQPTINQASPLAFIVEELSKQIEGAVSRVRVTQLANIPSDATQPLNLNIELPVRKEDAIDLFQIRIKEEDDEHNKQTNDKNMAWKVTLAFDLEALGPMYASITVFEKTVSTTLHAERSKTTKLIDRNLSTLSKNLTDVGLNVEKLVCLTGKPTQSSNTRIFQSFLDIKA